MKIEIRKSAIKDLKSISEPFKTKLHYKLERKHHFFNFIHPEFIIHHLKQLQKHNSDNMTVMNAREKFVIFLSSVELTKFMDSEKKRQSAIDDIQKFASIEAYLILKYPEKFIS